MFRSLFAASLIVALAGCETAGQAKDMATEGTSAFTCEQIRAAFAAYDADRTSFEALAELSGMTGYEFTHTASQTADVYYEKARNSANLALIVKGCDPL
jgi:hypothetical protein